MFNAKTPGFLYISLSTNTIPKFRLRLSTLPGAHHQANETDHSEAGGRQLRDFRHGSWVKSAGSGKDVIFKKCSCYSDKMPNWGMGGIQFFQRLTGWGSRTWPVVSIGPPKNITLRNFWPRLEKGLLESVDRFFNCWSCWSCCDFDWNLGLNSAWGGELMEQYIPSPVWLVIDAIMLLMLLLAARRQQKQWIEMRDSPVPALSKIELRRFFTAENVALPTVEHNQTLRELGLVRLYLCCGERPST